MIKTEANYKHKELNDKKKTTIIPFRRTFTAFNYSLSSSPTFASFLPFAPEQKEAESFKSKRQSQLDYYSPAQPLPDQARPVQTSPDPLEVVKNVRQQRNGLHFVIMYSLQAKREKVRLSCPATTSACFFSSAIMFVHFILPCLGVFILICLSICTSVSSWQWYVFVVVICKSVFVCLPAHLSVCL